MRGQTVGKRVFGLRTVSAEPSVDISYLSIPRSLLRYLALYGLVIVLAEIPPIAFRNFEATGSAARLELHMLLLLAYTCTNALLVAASRGHRGLHDRFACSRVVRVAEESQHSPAYGLPNSARLYLLCGSAGCIFAVLFWTMGTARPELLRPIFEYRYRIEHRANVRISNVTSDGERAIVEAVCPDKTRSNLPAAAQQLAAELAALDYRSAAVHLQLVALDISDRDAKSFQPRCFGVAVGSNSAAEEDCL